MLGFKKKSQSPTEFANSVGNAPLTAYEKAERTYFEAHGSPRVESSRWFLVSVMLAIACTALVLTINQMMPLKEHVPYMVTFSKEKGVAAEVVEAKRYRPDENIKIFFLSRFIENMRTIDPYLTQENLRSAYAVCRDKAIAEFRDFLDKEKPVEKLTADKGLIRTVKFVTINPGTQENIAFIRTKETERTGLKVTVKSYMFTIHYTILAPTEFETIQKNPAGIYITHFDRREEIDTETQN